MGNDTQRKKIIQIVKTSATGDFDKALSLAAEYLVQLKNERTNAEEAVVLVQELLSGEATEHCHSLKRKEVSEYLDIFITLHNTTNVLIGGIIFS